MQHRSIATNLSVLGPSIILRALAMDIFLPCIPAVATYYNVPFAVSQWVLSAFFLGAGIGQLFFGPWSDRFGRRPVLLIATILMIASSIACAQATNVYFLMVARFIQGLVACGTTVVTMAIMRDLYSNHALPKVYSYYNGVVALAPLLAPLLGGWMLSYTGSWQTTFYFVMAFSVVTLCINLLFCSETNQEFKLKNSNVWADYKKVLMDLKFLAYTACAIAGFSSLFIFFSTSSIIFIDLLQVTPHNFGIYFAIDTIVFLIGNGLSPYLQNNLTLDRVILAGSLIILFGGASILLAFWAFDISILSVLLPNMLATFGVGLILGPCMAGVMHNYKHIAGLASATYGCLLYGLSSILVALLMQFNINHVLLLGGTLLMLGMIIAFICNFYLIEKQDSEIEVSSAG